MNAMDENEKLIAEAAEMLATLPDINAVLIIGFTNEFKPNGKLRVFTAMGVSIEIDPNVVLQSGIETLKGNIMRGPKWSQTTTQE